MKPSRKRTLVADLMQRYGASQTQACAVLRISRSVYGYRARARDARPLVARIKEIAAFARKLAGSYDTVCLVGIGGSAPLLGG